MAEHGDSDGSGEFRWEVMIVWNNATLKTFCPLTSFSAYFHVVTVLSSVIGQTTTTPTNEPINLTLPGLLGC
jgi:hypothetical protein